MRESRNLTDGIILRLVDYGENDLIVGILTSSHGKLSVFAPSARKSQKRFGAGLDLFTYIQIDMAPPRNIQSHLWRLHRIELLDPHLGLRKDLSSLATASYLAECLWNFVGEGDHEIRIFEWWKETLKKLSHSSSAFSDIRLEVEMLTLCGYAPRWKNCIECGRSPCGPSLFFSYDHGGVICGSCKKIGAGTWLDTAWVSKLETGEDVPESGRSTVRRAMNGFISHTLGKEPKSQKFREEVLGESA